MLMRISLGTPDYTPILDLRYEKEEALLPLDLGTSYFLFIKAEFCDAEWDCNAMAV